MTKAELAERYNIGSTKLRRLLNVTFYEELKELGYNKKSKVLPPKVIRKFIELYGAPITEDDYEY